MPAQFKAGRPGFESRNVVYLITTIVLAFCILSCGAAETVHDQANVDWHRRAPLE